MYLLMVSLPLMGAFCGGFFGRFIGPKGAAVVTTGCVALAASLAFVGLYEVGFGGSPVSLKVASWIDMEMFDASWGFCFDSLTASMMVVVTLVSSLVHLYSTSYMSHDPHLPRFMAYLSLFTFFMIMLITGDNFLVMFLGWEGVGLCSYLLINFWFTRIQANKAAMKAMIVNRIGDFGFALGIIGVFWLFGSIEFSTVFAMVPLMAEQNPADLNIFFVDDMATVFTAICLALFVGAMGKSAQVGLHTWLPDAMEGPTPVSALIHAATMVTAGVFMIIRCSPLFEHAPLALVVVTVFGAMTAFFAATTGMVQNDLKKVIAYSTCSQLGYMVFACGISNYSASMFHLMNHAYFKALLFLSAGSVIHALSDEQDMRMMGGLLRLLPYTYTMILIGSLSLMGFPFLTGFYSKDIIIELAYAQYTVSGTFAHWLGCISALFTAFYSFRLIYFTFIRDTNAFRSHVAHVHEAPWPMAVPLFVLGIGSIFVGYWTKDLFMGMGTPFWGNAIFIKPENLTLIDSEFIPYYVKLIPVILSMVGAISAFLLYHGARGAVFAFQTSALGRDLYTFLNRKWFFDKVYNAYVVPPVLRFGYHTSFKLLDKGIIEMLGPYGLSTAISQVVRRFSAIQSGFLYHYSFFMLIGITVLILLVALGPSVGMLVENRLWFLFLAAVVFYGAAGSDDAEEGVDRAK